ncbi:protein of RNA polymerase II, Rpb4 family [Pseudohyphozyma bogoriensis]|nr:protein of RNA polymerase II, Rpb4 family [Pseudohyphozyma bogoriensis]
METISPRAGFLANHEVLTILRQHQQTRASQISALTKKRDRRLADLGRKAWSKEVEDAEMDRVQPQDLHTVTFECIKYLEESVHPIRRQTEASISTLLDELEKLDLTKAERLQIINLAPTTLVALVVCVEDFEQRFPTDESQKHILNLVKSHLSAEVAPSVLPTATASTRNRKADYEEDEMDEDQIYAAEDDPDEDFVNEPGGGGGGGQEKELDEVVET